MLPAHVQSDSDSQVPPPGLLPGQCLQWQPPLASRSFRWEKLRGPSQYPVSLEKKILECQHLGKHKDEKELLGKAATGMILPLVPLHITAHRWLRSCRDAAGRRVVNREQPLWGPAARKPGSLSLFRELGGLQSTKIHNCNDRAVTKVVCWDAYLKKKILSLE